MTRLIAIALVLFSPLVSTAADFNIGDKVFVKPDAEAMIDGNPVDIGTIPIPAIVVEIKDDMVFLRKAWVPKNDVMTADEALEFYNERIRQQPQDSMAFANRGRVRAAKGLIHSAKAINDFDEAIKLDPNNSKAYLGRGIVKGVRRHLKAAINDLTEAIRLDPTDASAYDNLSVTMARNGDFDAAIKYSTEAISLDLTDAMARFNRGACWLEKGECNNAIRDFSEAIRLEPLCHVFYFNRGCVWYRKGDFDNAIKDYTNGIKIKPNSNCYTNRGAIWANRGEPEEAIEDWTIAISLNPMHELALNNIARILATCPDDDVRNGENAVKYATEACVLTNWRVSNRLDTLAAAYAESGDFASAVKWAEKTLELTPESRKEKAVERLELYKANKPYRYGPHANWMD